jgi:AAA family ATP:ADP antiporter
MNIPDTTSSGRPGLVDRALRLFAPVRAGEGLLALLMFGCVFTILCAYYVLKTAREGLILTSGFLGLTGDELKVYASGAMAALLVGLVPLYGALASKVRRIRLVNWSYSCVVGSLVVFFTLASLGVAVGIAFYIWLGLVNMFLVAQFWSYATDLYTEEQGKRLFAIIAIGGSAGAIVGPKLTAVAGVHALLLLAAAMLTGCLALFNLVERLHVRRSEGQDQVAAAPIGGAGGFHLVLRDRYLLLIAVMLIVANLVNSTGEYLLSNAARTHAAQLVPASAHADLVGAARDAAISADRREVIKAFYGDFFFWVNAIGFLVQAFLVSRLIAKLGVRAALFVLPLVALAGYGAIAAAGGIALIRAAKIAENATDYSLQNTVRQTLFLPTDRAVKYKAKAAIDTFFVRFGDTISAILVGFGIHALGLGAGALALMNVGLVVVWLAAVVGVARGHRKLTRTTRRLSVSITPPGGHAVVAPRADLVAGAAA